ncbi:ABC transporter ATP-binding protein [Brevibacillus choshinensis]|uniref:ABC transporter ATP-binding protein n=1 Tax=Brevibacillus choshinensis TaxID=54911 RepID=UPI002E22E846|nr:ABC transporter ATP-binding protein [Brevibacillus choshinensis]
MEREMILKASQISKYYGGVRAVDEVSLTLNKGERIGLIGPNGAGKSTLFNLLSGAIQPTKGTIEIKGQPLTNKKPEEFSLSGVARTFQNIRLFKGMTVLENVIAGLHRQTDTGLLKCIFGSSGYRATERRIKEKASELLNDFALYDQRERQAVHLSYGDQRRLEIVRALATDPQILFLDEPAAGMNPQESHELVDLIEEVWEKHQLTVFLIEHDMDVIMRLCEHIYVLDYGKLLFDGTPDEVRQSAVVREAYLGGEVHA